MAAKKGSGRRKKRRSRLTAATADRHALYQRAVQSPEADVDFLLRAYRQARGTEPRHLREDFCGTAILSATWAAQDEARTAEGYDLDAETLAWGTRENLRPLGEAADRVQLFQKDVRETGRQPADVRCAQNFSYQVFHRRQELIEYFRAAREDLADDGIFVLDAYGGTEAVIPLEEERDIDGDFIYVWDQDQHWPGTGEHLCFIHFRFPDGTEMREAFRYDWRLYTLPELKDALHEAGFRQIHTWFESFDEDGEGEGDYELDERGHPAEGWIAYLVALK